MTQGKDREAVFNWTDLSAYRVDRAIQDYGQLFGWSFQGSHRYKYALSDSAPVAAIFKMPHRFAKLKMPAFWMSYINVANLDRSIELVERHEKAAIEIAPEPFGSDARIALIRDPSGAGVTLYEGPDLATDAIRRSPGDVIDRYQHGPKIKIVQPFYEAVFGWSFEKVADHPWPAFDARNANSIHVAKFEQVPTDIRGKFSYWMPCFAVQEKHSFLATLEKLNGQVLHNFGDGRLMIADRQQAHFLIQSTA